MRGRVSNSVAQCSSMQTLYPSEFTVETQQARLPCIHADNHPKSWPDNRNLVMKDQQATYAVKYVMYEELMPSLFEQSR